MIRPIRKKQSVDILTALVLREIKSMKPAPNRLMQMARWLQAPTAAPLDRRDVSTKCMMQLMRLACMHIESTSGASFAVHSFSCLIKALNAKQVAELEVEIDKLYQKHVTFKDRFADEC